MGVATRGVKFKFSAGEKVLCYEPDPTKARVLYDSKVLKLETSHDERGRKVPEYLIHFSGWNSSWDRCVREEFILPFTEENQELQTKLAKDAALTIKGKRKYKLPRLIKNSLAKQLSTDDESEKNDKLPSLDHSSESESSEEEIPREVTISIPPALKVVLEEDWKCIVKKNKVIKLPCEPNVISILESFVKHFAGKMLCAPPPKIPKLSHHMMPDNVQNKLNLCKETVDGIRQCFDFTLPHLLLYNQEKKLHYTDGLICSPVTVNCDKESQDPAVTIFPKIENEFSDSTSDCHIPSQSELPLYPSSRKTVMSPTLKKEIVFPEADPPSPPPPRTQKGRSNLRSLRLPPSVKPEKSELAAANNVPKSRPPQMKVFKKAARGRPKSADSSKCIRVLRSRKNEDKVPTVNVHENSQSSMESKMSTDAYSEPESNPIRLTRKYALHCGSSVSSAASREKTSECATLCVSDRALPLHLPSVSGHPSASLTSNSISSSGSSSHSTFSTPLTHNQFTFLNNATLLHNILQWNMLPLEHYERIPAAPSLIYGAHHLLRLFVKLPELLSKMNIPRRKLEPLMSILDKLLLYLVEQKDILFVSSCYVEIVDDVHEASLSK